MSTAVRTDMYCHECTRNFVTRLDLRLDGNHVIHCPCSPASRVGTTGAQAVSSRHRQASALTA